MDKKKIIYFFGATQFLLIAMNGLWSYGIIYFRELGFDSRQIGLMSSVGTFLAMGMLPLLGIVSDRWLSPRKVFLLVAVTLVVVNALFPVCGFLLGAAFVPFAVLVTIRTVGTQVSSSMLESWAGAEMDRLHASFGNVRRFGSLGYVVTSLIASVLVGPVLPTSSCFVIMPVLGICMLLICAGPKSKRLSGETEKKAKKQVKTGELLGLVLKNYYFMTFLLMVLAFDGFLAIVNLDMSYLMDYAGTAQSNVGVVGAVRAATEIVVMIWLSKRKKLPPLWTMMGAASLLIAAEHLLYPYVRGLGGMVAVTLCSGLAGGMYYCYGTNYVFQIVDHRAASTAMSILGLVKAAIGVVGSAVGGEVIARYGVITLTNAVGIFALVLSVLFIITAVVGRYVLKKPYIHEQEALT